MTDERPCNLTKHVASQRAKELAAEPTPNPKMGISYPEGRRQVVPTALLPEKSDMMLIFRFSTERLGSSKIEEVVRCNGIAECLSMIYDSRKADSTSHASSMCCMVRESYCRRGFSVTDMASEPGQGSRF